MKHNLKKSCWECPYIGNVPTWIGAHRSPQEFVDLANADARFPCHMTIDYEARGWKEKVESGDVEQCVGQLAFMNKGFKLSRTREVAAHQNVIAKDKSIVVLWPPEHLVAVHSAPDIMAGVRIRDAAKLAPDSVSSKKPKRKVK